jgi:hypothetical protein
MQGTGIGSQSGRVEIFVNLNYSHSHSCHFFEIDQLAGALFQGPPTPSFGRYR